MRKIGWVLALSAFFLLQAGCSKGSLQNSAKPKLAVVIVVDQMRADHLTRFAGLYKHGLARILQGGMRFTNAHHDHARTVTAVGHATISTGAFPAHHGIVGNSWFDHTEQGNVYCSLDTAFEIIGHPEDRGCSPAKLLRTTAGDWLQQASPASKVFSISRKDRAAIMMGGQHPDGAFWYHGKDGTFVTSKYYMDAYPKWVDAFNRSGRADRFFQDGWQKSRPEEAYFVAREDRFEYEKDDNHARFPHLFRPESAKPDRAYYSKLIETPFSDALLLEFARELVKNEQLGQDDAPDILWISCSAADAVGHAYGPLSQESEDLFLRLDRNLGEFFDFLDRQIGRDSYFIVLSSDHGVLPLPEELARRDFKARRISMSEIIDAIQPAFDAVNRELNFQGDLIKEISNGLILNYEAADRAGVDRALLRAKLAEKLRRVPFFADVYTRDELLQNKRDRHGKNGDDGVDYFRLFQHSLHPDRSADLLLQFKKYYLISSRKYGTSHGSPYRYDTWVPIVFAGPGIQPGEHDKAVRTVDIAPTLAALLGITPPKDVDGENLLTKPFAAN